MSVPVAVDELRAEIAKFSSDPFLLTVSDHGLPHCVAGAVSWDGEELVMRVGKKTAANATARPAVSMLWAPGVRGEFSLIVDGTIVSVTPAPAGGNHMHFRPSHAVLHRPASPESASTNECAPVFDASP
ncbi:MAG: hypothetical protein ACHQDE_03630 [Acidimicrobiia bacterium]